MDRSADTEPPHVLRKPGRKLKKSFFARSVHEVAPDLIGATFLVDGVGGIIVEMEAYDQTDPAAHSFRGPTPRNMVMFGPPGFTCVYLSYGLKNFVCQAAGSAAGVLICAIEPTHSLAHDASAPRRRGRGRAVLRPRQPVRGARDNENTERAAARQAAVRATRPQRRS
jgi:DNA-3-methyladenine glycosylase